MKLSIKWLQDYVDINTDNMRDYAHTLTMTGSKVEGYKYTGEEISNVVVGKVLEINQHPDADKLVVCKIDVAKENPVQIVTGATNVLVGALVPVALHKSTLVNGVKIKKGKLRGVESEGMLCSVAELGLTVNDFPYAIEDGIFLIQEPCEIGQDIKSAVGLDDICVEFEITSNRPDCLSITGLARETAASYNLPLNIKEPCVKGSGGDINEHLAVEVLNPKLCPRYSAKIIKNVKIEPSPRWMRERLRVCGIRPINNFVDITNYVMLEYGQPLHAFDASFIEGDKLIIRNAQKDEKIQTLDGVDRTLNENMLVIADTKKAVAVAGVMGGENSCILENTNTVVFESANFLGKSVRLTAKALGLRTDASARYEKGLDPQTTINSVMRACELVELLGAGEVVDGLIDVDNSSKELTKIPLEIDWLNKFIGINITKEQAIQMLKPLGFIVDGDEVIVPSFRADVTHKADIAEEIARIYGYDKIPTSAVKGVAKGSVSPYQSFERKIHKILQSAGCYEVATYSFISPKYYDKINLPEDWALRNSVTILNPLGEETSVMRTTTLPSMLEVLAKNYNNRNTSFCGYEIGNEYIPIKNQDLPNENPQVTIGLYGNESDFFTLKGIVETMLTRIGVKDFDFTATSENPTFHPGRCAVVTKDDKQIGTLGEVHPLVLENYDIGKKAYLAKFDVQVLYSLANSNVEYKHLPKFPSSSRDLSLVCDEDLPIGDIEKIIKSAVGNILESTKLFDIYKGSQIAQNKKSVSYSIIMRSDSQTLTDAQADEAINRLLNALEKINVTIRS